MEAAQRLRLAVAMAEEMQERGYVETPVAAVLKRAGISRATFYALYDDKLACFLDAMDLAEATLFVDLDGAASQDSDRLALVEQAIADYLGLISQHRSFARLFLVEAHAAGVEALRRRARLQDRVAEGLADLLGVASDDARFACRAFVAAIAGLVVVPIVTADDAALRSLEASLIRQVRILAQVAGPDLG